VQLSEEPRAPFAIWSNAHWISAGAAILAARALAHLIGGTGAWPAAGFAATVVYLVLNAVQSTTARRATGAG
jgi:hypothetical protein